VDLPSQVLASGVLVWDPEGRLLMVKTLNRDHWILPGGLVEEGESPRAAGVREVFEETGLAVEAGRLLVVEHLPSVDRVPASIQFVFDSTPLTNQPGLVLQEQEIEGAQWCPPDEAVRLHGERGRGRLRAALAARQEGSTAWLDGSWAEDSPRLPTE